MHARMARQHGDLSADVPDPVADWEAKGVTYQSFEYYKPALENGLSSRTIMGESGPSKMVMLSRFVVLSVSLTRKISLFQCTS